LWLFDGIPGWTVVKILLNGYSYAPTPSVAEVGNGVVAGICTDKPGGQSGFDAGND
jgi:hypothetical protein